MRVAIVAECFTPTWNGVTNSVSRTVDHLAIRGHRALVVAPGLAAPVLLGEAGGRVCRRLGVPTVASYQTDLPGFASSYHLRLVSSAAWAWLRHVHGLADLTLAPSSAAEWDLRQRGIGPVARWGRGVDTVLWNPERRDDSLRRMLLGRRHELLVGYAGRLAAEKRVAHLRHLRGLPGVGVVVVGAGPDQARLQGELPEARFVGFQQGEQLARTVASLDVFVHTGPHETYCQAVQEAMACGVPVVAPASGGILDLVAHGRTGWLYPPARPEVLREAVATLAADPLLRSTMGATAHQSVQDRTWGAIGDQLIGHYRSVLPAVAPAERARHAA
jgi:phosphatidylinositol alpha 1,6-mannosyltransferase